MYQPFETRKWSWDTGDLIGIESSVDLSMAATSSAYKGVRRSREKEFTPSLPPPLPPRGVMKRHSTCDGRLVIESGSLPDVLRARRENNRLTIDLDSLCSDDRDLVMDGCDEVSSDQTADEEEQEEPMMIRKYDHVFEMDGGDGASDDRTADEEELPVRIYKFGYGVRSNPCMVGIAAPAIRHVRI